MVDIVDDLTARLIAAEARADALHAALRKVAVVLDSYPNHCRLCDALWAWDDTENHDPGCLAAPKEQSNDA